MLNARATYHNFANFRRKLKIISLGFFGFMLVLLLYILCVQIFKIRRIELVGEGIKLNVDDKKMSQNIIFISTDRIKNDILTEHPEIQYIHISKKLPDTLVIGISTRRPAAHILLLGTTKLVDDQGKIMNYTLPLNQIYPTIHLNGYNSVEQIDSRIIKRILDLLTYISRYEKILVITIDNSGYYQLKIDKTDIIIPQNMDIYTTETTLQTLLTRFRMKGTVPTQIDLRFDKPVIRF
jgi:cell division septal protein FtsQ